MSFLRVLAVGVVSCALVACKTSPAPVGQDSGPPPSASPAASASPAPPPAKLVDLLRFAPATVAVSSKVDNPKDFPEHLVDGEPETAWNGKTGDLAGGWLAFRVPKDARVKRIELTAGFDNKSGAKDLFSMNVRITRVRVMRDGQLVKEASLDPARRDLQPIELDEAGGDFRLEVTEVAPGTRADYKELCVSELAVMGIPGKERFDHVVLPRVFVGSLEGHATVTAPPAGAAALPAASSLPPSSPGPYPTPEAFCAAQKKRAAPELLRVWGSEQRYPGDVPPFCKIDKLDVKAKLAPPFMDVTGYTAAEPMESVSGVLLKTDRGWWLTPWQMWTHAHDDPGCMHGSHREIGELASPDPKLSLVWMRLLSAESYWMQVHDLPDGGLGDSESWTTWEETLDVCRVDAANDVVCEKRQRLAIARDEAGSPDSAHAKPPFTKRLQPRLGAAGAVELAP